MEENSVATDLRVLERELALCISLGVDEVSQTFDLREVKATAFECASSELSAFSRTAEWQASNSIQHG